MWREFHAKMTIKVGDMRNVFPSVFRFPALCQKLAQVDNNCVLIQSNSAQFNIQSFCQTIISPLHRNRYEVWIIKGQYLSASFQHLNWNIKYEPCIHKWPSDDQTFQLFDHQQNHKNNLVPETEANFMLLYLYLIIMPHVLPQFISPNGHSSWLWLFQWSRVITRWPQRVPHLPQPLVTPRVRG